MDPFVILDDYIPEDKDYRFSSEQAETPTSNAEQLDQELIAEKIALPNISEPSWRGLVKANQPIAETGALKHSFYWLFHALGLMHESDSLSSCEESAAEGKTVIYFVHGTFDQPSGCMDLKSRLEQHLPADQFTLKIAQFQQRYRGRSVDSFAHQLREQILLSGDKRVILVGHSRGGLVASHFAENIAPHCEVDVPLVATIGTPFQGSAWAKLVAPFFSSQSSIAQMKPGSPFLEALCTKIQTSLADSKRVYRFYAATRDWLVSVQANSIELDSSSTLQYKRTLNRHGHLSVMSSHRLVQDLLQMITTVSVNEMNNQVELRPSPAMA